MGCAIARHMACFGSMWLQQARLIEMTLPDQAMCCANAQHMACSGATGLVCTCEYVYIYIYILI